LENQKVSISDYARSLIRFKSRQMVGRAGFNESDLEDIEQELTVYLLDNLPRHDAAKSSENTFVSMLLDGKVAKMLRRRSQGQRDHRREEFSLNDRVVDDLGDEVQRVNIITADEACMRWGTTNCTREDEVDRSTDVVRAVNELPDDLRHIAELLKVERPAEVARRLKMPRTTLNRAIERIRKAFEADGLEDYL